MYHSIFYFAIDLRALDGRIIYGQVYSYDRSSLRESSQSPEAIQGFLEELDAIFCPSLPDHGPLHHADGIIRLMFSVHEFYDLTVNPNNSLQSIEI